MREDATKWERVVIYPWQRDLLTFIEKAYKEGKSVAFCMPPRSGMLPILKMVDRDRKGEGA